MNETIKMHLATVPYRESSIHMQICEWLHYHLGAKNPKNSNNNTNALIFLKCNYKYKRRSIFSESNKLSRSIKRRDPSIVASKATSRESMLKRESRNTNNSATRVILRLLMAITGQLMKRHTSPSMSIDASATSASTSDVINNQVIDNIVSTRYYSGKLTLNRTQKKTLAHASKQSMQSLSLLPLLPSLPSLQSLQPPKGIPKTQPFNSRNRFNMLDTTTTTARTATTARTTTATSSSMAVSNSLWQQHQQPSDDSGNSNSPSSKAVLVNRHCQHRQQKQQRHQQYHHQHQRHQPEVLSMFMALFIALTLCARSAEAGACWQTALGNGKCKEIFARNSSRADCCVSGRELFYTERELTDVEYFFASAIGEGIECAPCMETCKNVDCGPNKKCVKRKGRAKCICAPECGAALRQRQRQQQQQQGHYRSERIYRGNQHHNEQWHNDQSAPEGVTTVAETSAAAASAAAAIAAWAAKSPRDIRSLSSEITNINLGTDGDTVALETTGQQQSSQKSQHQNQRKIIVMQSQSQEKPQIRTRKDQKPRRLLVESQPKSEHEEKTTTRRLQIIANVRGNGRGTGHRRRLNDKTSSSDDDVVTAAATDYRHQQRHNNNKNHNNNNDKSIIKGHSNELVHSKQRHHQHHHRQHKQHNRNHNNRVRGMHQTIDGDRDSSNYDAIEVERKHEAREQQQQNHRKRKHHNRSKHRKPKDPNANINNSNSSTNNNNNNHDISVFAAIYNAKFPTAPAAAAAAGTGTATLQTTAATTTPVNSSSSADHQKHLFNHGSSNIATSSSTSTLSSSSTSLWSSSTNNTLNPPVAPTTTTVEGGNALNALTLLDGIYNNYNLHGFPLQQEQHRFMFGSTHHNAHPVCGTDGRTYNTECQLKKRACRTDNSNLQVAYRGHCKTSCNGVKCLNGFTCVEDHYTIPHCIACKIECSDEDDDHYAFNNDGRHRGTVADVTVDGVGVGRDVAKGIDAATSRAVCGVDGKTYKSTCDINRMICKIGRSIAVAYPGPCRADRVSCNDISCGPKYTCLVDLLTHEPRCVYCRYKCSRKRRPSSLRFEEGKICGVNNRTYSSWCEMRKDSCNTGFFIDVKAPGECQ